MISTIVNGSPVLEPRAELRLRAHLTPMRLAGSSVTFYWPKRHFPKAFSDCWKRKIHLNGCHDQHAFPT